MFYSKILSDLPEYRLIAEHLNDMEGAVHVYGVSDSRKSHLIYSLCEQSGIERCLIVASDETEAGRIKNDLSFFFCDEIFYFPSKEYIFYDVDAANRDEEYKRLRTLAHLDRARVVVTTAKALLQYTVPKNVFNKYCRTLSVGDIIEADKFCASLAEIGYKRVSAVEGMGQFARRGSIIDVFTPVYDDPLRIELFDDEVDSLRLFDAQTQMSLKNIDSCRMCPARELIYDSDGAAELEKRIKALNNLNLNFDAEKISQQHYIASGDKYMPFVYGEITSFVDLYNAGMTVYDEPGTLSEGAKAFCEEQNEIIATMLEKGLFPKTKREYMLTYSQLTDRVDKRSLISISSLSYSTPDFRPKEIVGLSAKTMQNYSGNLGFLCDDIEYWKKADYRIIIVAGSKNAALSLCTSLAEHDIEAAIITDYENLPPLGTVSIAEGNLTKGFEYPSAKTAVISETDIYTHRKKHTREKKVDAKNRIKSFDELNKGDFVVHNVHGIGQYVGLEQIKSEGVVKDFLKIRYKGTDVLYVPANQLDAIHKYIGASEGSTVALNSLNGGKWQKTVTKVKQSVEKMAENLIRLYAARQNVQGHVFEPDTEWQKEFEDDFSYDETPDQLRCIEEVKSDMEHGKCMDRLLCGDVGYGKTEVALRAAFKCVMGGMQVAYLVPTTLLAQQHYNTFSARMKDYGVNVELLCRFRSKKEQAVTVERLKQGKADVVIGTHRLVSKDIGFKNLGLLIIDEEQRFGVGHKEKLKEMKESVDVLTLSATPIPRTLNMAMVGIRDLSVIASPPQDRYPVQTFVMERNGDVIKNAIEREIARGGQVYYLSNRVDNIERKAAMLRALVPDAVIDVAHGQMSERELENKMLDMMNGDTDILVCTTIIETGIDIPNVNTMIIDGADRLGLSQLYQLRGRVGRSNRLAYAYLMYDGGKVLDEIARKRLSAIKEFTEFGSGFRIAMRDLEIRGAGNLLGKEQHGNMNLVGYDMYCALLGEAVARLKGEDIKESAETTVDLKVDVHIPQSYINEEQLRFEFYKKASDICCEEDYLNLQSELTDRFGDMPRSVENLIECMYIKSLAQRLNISSVVRSDKDILMTIDGEFSTKAIIDIMDDYKGKIMFSSGEKSYISYKYDEKFLSNIKIILQKLIKITQESNMQL